MAQVITGENANNVYGTIPPFAGTAFTVIGPVGSDTVTNVALTGAEATLMVAVTGLDSPIVPTAVSFDPGSTMNPLATTLSVSSTPNARAVVVTMAASKTMLNAGTTTDNDDNTALDKVLAAWTSRKSSHEPSLE